MVRWRGIILGTAPYMSPEQARGKEVDARADIWAFGCVLFEMLTGKQTFAGETTTDVLAKVLEGQPRWDALPAETPPSMRMLLEAALSKDPKQRLQHIGDARLFLNKPITFDTSVAPIAPHRKERHAWLVSAILAVALVASLVPIVLRFMQPPAEVPVVRFEMPAPGFVAGTGLAISPDGQRIAYVAVSGGKSAIWIRSISSLTAQELPGTENGLSPFWAPDSHRVAFFADGKLKKIDISGSVPQTLGDAPSSVFQVPGAWNRGGGNSGAVYFGSLDSKSTVRLMGIPPNFDQNGTNSAAMYAQGYLLFSRDRTLQAQHFDPVQGKLSGEPVSVAENVGRDFSVSETGVLVYRSIPGQSGQTTVRHLSWFDRKGKPASEISTPANVGSVRLSHDAASSWTTPPLAATLIYG